MEKNEDVLENSLGTDTFDFMSLRPTINNAIKNLASLNKFTVKTILRCDLPNKNNINTYQELIRMNNNSKVLTMGYVSKYIQGVSNEKIVLSKSSLFLHPNENSKTESYLVKGDKVKVIQYSEGNDWVNIGYINKKGMPLVAWMSSASIDK